MQNAVLGAKEQAAGRGLLNSSMAAGAGRRAAIDAGFQVASQDAETYAGFKQRQQSGDIEGVLQRDASKYGLESVREQGKVEGTLAGEKYGYESTQSYQDYMQSLDADSKMGGINAQQSYQDYVQGLDKDSKTSGYKSSQSYQDYLQGLDKDNKTYGYESKLSYQDYTQDLNKSVKEHEQDLEKLGISDANKTKYATMLNDWSVTATEDNQAFQNTMLERGFTEAQMMASNQMIGDLGMQGLSDFRALLTTPDVTDKSVSDWLGSWKTMMNAGRVVGSYTRPGEPFNIQLST